MVFSVFARTFGQSYILRDRFYLILFVCLIVLILYTPSTIVQLNRDGPSWVEPVLSLDICVLLKDHNAVMPVRLEPAAPRSQVKHSTTEPLRSLYQILLYITLINEHVYVCFFRPRLFSRTSGGCHNPV